ncbi:murein L,D-transpeptidase family protein [Paracoccus sp. IB05]|uniref:L,D-transpeptidase family protein n=1 Tax=Paracoccus sp. IB05 TaxID=2779367 RepID=UPI0018E7AC0D|nr:L,D-transpeptidase family protein [Paracoccus sp. IB05]MBJ2150390.1 L,D-transpeptidase family protein [Paracoccus sp. IB05]
MKQLARLFTLLSLSGLILAALLFWPRLVPAPGPDATPLPPLSGEVERIVIEKSTRRMALIQDGKEVRVYRIALGFAPDGSKEREGDGRTPEGEFRIDRRNDQSAYHLSLGLDYPQPADRARARAGGYSPGGDIMIHGQPNMLPDDTFIATDWTAGCIAISNAEMREIWAATPVGTMVEIRP